ncbi:Plectin [Liparis tanakae]|uniref:Plectin n=1 Tax=Liparis tanakae TaxID=230148 RepID=A0A4Z2HSU0_9TELE|nr:Plectin [Liparis tanakae]
MAFMHQGYELKYLFRRKTQLERLQRVVSKVQMESGVCEEQLNQVETLLQTVRRQHRAARLPSTQNAAL